MESVSGEEEQEFWFGEKGRHESSAMESGSSRDCCGGKSDQPRLWEQTKIGLMMIYFQGIFDNHNHFSIS